MEALLQLLCWYIVIALARRIVIPALVVSRVRRYAVDYAVDELCRQVKQAEDAR